MEKLRLQISFLILSLMGLLACKDDVVDPYPASINSDMYDCHQMETWDENSTHDALVGEWIWEYRSCTSFTGHTAGYVDTLGVVFEFNADTTLNVLEHGLIIQTATWQVDYRNANEFYMYTYPWISQLQGAIYFCEDRVAFSAAEVDGCNNYLRKK